MVNSVRTDRRWPQKLLRFAGFYLCSIVITLVVLYGALCIPWRVQREFDGVEIRMGSGDSHLVQATSIRIDGWAQHRPFAYATFEGDLQIDAYPETNSHLIGLTFMNGFSNGSLTYGDSGRLMTLGMLFTDRDFNSVAIELFDDVPAADGSGTISVIRDRVIAAPAKDVSEAGDVLFQRDLHWMRDFTGMIYIPPELPY